MILIFNYVRVTKRADSVMSINIMVPSCFYRETMSRYSEKLERPKACHSNCLDSGARCSSVVSALAHGAMGRRIDPSWGGPIELFLVPASAPRLV